jgi:hypothetical protein
MSAEGASYTSLGCCEPPASEPQDRIAPPNREG